MKETKFRAWDRLGKRMFDSKGYVFKFYDRGPLSVKDVIENIQITLVEPELIVMQFTGLYDKKKTPIYEGDILRTDRGNYYILEALPFIRLTKGRNDDYDNGDFYEGGNIQSHNWKSFEVIGNIYENQELLKEVGNA